MEAILFCGIQATGKSTFYKEHFFNSHMRISLDLLNTRNKENRFLDTCIALHQRFVVDNTNPSKADRKKYIDLAKAAKYKVIGYYFQSNVKEAIQRNAQRIGKAKTPEKGIMATRSKLELPSWGEGFDELYFVTIEEGKGFSIERFKD